MHIDLEKLSDHELIELNRHIVDIIQSRRQRKTMRELSKFSIGDMVEFKNDSGEMIQGMVIRVNQKTITIETHQPCLEWRVSPHIVSKIKSPAQGIDQGREATVTPLFRS